MTCLGYLVAAGLGFMAAAALSMWQHTTGRLGHDCRHCREIMGHECSPM